MRLGKEIVGKPVISVEDGRRVGSVKDLYLDSDLTTVAGIYLGSEGLLSRTGRVILGDDISVLGFDAVLVTRADVVREEDEVEGIEAWVLRDKLRGREVATPGGTKIGRIGDVILDPEAHIEGFQLDRIYVEGPVAKQGAVARYTMVDPGHDDGIMTADLAEVEGQGLQAV